MKKTFLNTNNSGKNCRQFNLFLVCFILITFVCFSMSVTYTASASSEIELSEKTYGNEHLPAPKILVAYATRAGSTIEVANAIGKRLAEQKAFVDVKPIKKISCIKEYHTVVIGSAIRRGAVLPEVMNFVKANKDKLEKIPVACFIVCMILREDNEETRKTASSYLDPLRAELSFVDIGFFAGKLDYSKLNFIDAFVVEHIIGTPEGDMRDWQKINDWAQNLAPKLLENK